MKPDAIIDEMLNKNPLIIFSLYIHVQSGAVQTLGREILAYLDAGIMSDDGKRSGIICSGEVIRKGYDQFWFWTLGAYEVVRTMCQAEKCFSDHVKSKLKGLKRKLALLRIPFAKQELPGKEDVPVRAEPSICRFGDSPTDLRFEVKGQAISARDLIGEFATVFGSISRADVLADHRTIYFPAKGGRLLSLRASS